MLFRQGRARISARRPQAMGVCDCCGFTFSLADLTPQTQWMGTQLRPTGSLVCTECRDTPQEQLRTIRIPPDPLPVPNPRPEPYSSEVPSYRGTEEGDTRETEEGDIRILETGLPQLYP